MHFRKTLRILSLSAAIALSGCHAATTGTPGTAPSPYQQAAFIMQSFSQDVLQAQQTEKNLYVGGAIPKTAHVSINQALLQIGNIGPQIDALIRAQAAPATINAKVQEAEIQIAAILQAQGVIDANTQTQINGVMQVIKTLLDRVNQTLTSSTTSTTGALTHGPGYDGNGDREPYSYRAADLHADSAVRSGKDERRGYSFA